MRMRDLVREGWTSALAQRAGFIATVLIVAGMCVAVLLTAGRAEAAANAVLSTFDDVGTRTVTVRVPGGSGLDAGVVDRVSSLDDVEAVVGFGAASDSVNAGIPGGTRVAVRTVTTGFVDSDDSSTVYASPEALSVLGLDAPAGGVTELFSGRSFGVAGEIEVPDYLAFLEPLVVRPRGADDAQPLSVLVVVAVGPQQVGEVADAVEDVLGLPAGAKASIATSEALAELRGIVDGQLSGFAQSLTAGIVGLAVILIGVVLFALVMLRRKEFGRRRALGATRGFIVGLVIIQTLIPSVIGSLVGVACALVALLITAGALPTAGYVLSLVYIAVLSACIAAVLPAVVASRREPIVELRVP